MTTVKKPKIFLAMPCYDSVKINTMISMLKFINNLNKAGIVYDIATLKTPYISYARNILTAKFMASDKDYLLFIDADVEFEPECPLRMLIAQRDIILTPYRIKTNDPAVVKYTTTVRDPKAVTVFMSACIPAPPLESDPAIINTLDLGFNLQNCPFNHVNTLM